MVTQVKTEFLATECLMSNPNPEITAAPIIDTGKKFDTAKIIALAKAQRAMLIVFLGRILVGLCAVFIIETYVGISVEAVTSVAALYVGLLLGLLLAVFSYRMARTAEMSVPWLWAIFVMFGSLGFLVLLLISSKANRILKSHGLKVGLMGVGKAELERFESSDSGSAA